MNRTNELFVSLALSPWSLGLKQLLRGADLFGGRLPAGERILELYPAFESDSILLFAWIYWLLDGCCEDRAARRDRGEVSLECSLGRVKVFQMLRKKCSPSFPENKRAFGEGRFLVDGKEFLKILISPGSAGGILIRHEDSLVPWIFPEGDGLYYLGGEEESRILPVCLIDEALKFADAVSAGN